MKAARLMSHGLEELIVTDVAEPIEGPGEVRIAVETVGVNQLDFNVIAGIGPGAAATLPRTLGLDPAGTIVATGEGVDPARIGERVVVKPNIPCGECAECAAAREADCRDQRIVGVHCDGGAAAFIVVPAGNAFGRGPLDAATATATVHSVPIVLNALDVAGVGAEDLVLVTGASGTLGRAAVELAVGRGARVIAVSRSAIAVPEGAVGLHCPDASGIPAAVAALRMGAPTVAIDASGHGAVTAAATAALGWRGRAVFCSASVDPLLPLDGRDFYLKRKTLAGVASADFAHVVRALELVAQGIVHPAIAAHYRMEDIGDAYRAFASRATGKVIVDVA